MSSSPVSAQTRRAREGRGVPACALTLRIWNLGSIAMRICLVYDCLFPHTVGGAERWYRSLAERLAADGHEVTYLTLRQWDAGVDPALPGVDVRVVGPRMQLYDSPGHRRILPPLVFGAGVLWHLLRHGRRYDVVHTCSFPYFSLLAAAMARPLGATASPLTGSRCGAAATGASTSAASGGDSRMDAFSGSARACRSGHSASRELYARRLRTRGCGARSRCSPGPTTARWSAPAGHAAEPLVVFAGRHIPEKRVPAIVPAIARAARAVCRAARGDPR